MDKRVNHIHILLVLVTVMIHLNFLSSSPDGVRTLYITPSSSVQCHAKPCLTLTQLVQTSSRWLSSNAVLIFLSGNHTLNTVLFISNINNVSMLTNPTSEGTYVVIFCLDHAHFIFDHINDLRINGLKFIGCGSNRFTSVKNFMIDNSTFQGQNNSGTVLDIADTNLIIVNSSFVSNRVGTCVEIFGVAIKCNIPIQLGGAIVVSTSNINIIKCNFLENSAEMGGAMYIDDFSDVSIVNSTFVNNHATIYNTHTQDCWTNNNIDEFLHIGGAITTFASRLTIDSCTFTNNTSDFDGGALSVQQESVANIRNSEFYGNRALNGSGGVLVVSSFTTVFIEDSKFHMNCATHYGGVVSIIVANASEIIGRKCVYEKNFAELSGGVVSVDQGGLFYDCRGQFYNNRANTGGFLFAIRFSNLILSYSEFHGNRALNGSGGVIFISLFTNVTIESSEFLMNSAIHHGGVIYIAYTSLITGRDCLYENNFVGLAGGVVSMDRSSLFHDNHGQFYNNRAKTGGVLYAIRSQVILVDNVFSYNQALEFGGVMYLLQCQQEVGFSSLTYNYAGEGGAIYAVESTLDVFSGQLMTIKFNVASVSGGGIFLYRSTLSTGYATVTDISNNKARENGGGIYAINSIIVCTQLHRKGRTWPFQTLLFITNNSANRGGGLLFESAAQLRIQKATTGDYLNLSEDKVNTSIYITANSAQDNGSAIYVADETYFDICKGSHSMSNIIGTTNTECFIQLLSDATELSTIDTSIEFNANNNNSSTNSTVIFGGLLDRCIPDPRAEIFANGHIHKKIDGYTYLKLISNLNDTKYISSLPVSVCFCTLDNQPDCSYEPPTVHVKKGESFNVSLVVVDQVNHTLKNIIVHSSLSHEESKLGEGQSSQVTGNTCTNLTFNIYSPRANEQVIFYAEGPCRNARKSQRKVYVVFKPCTCPIGFQQMYKSNDCVCVCDSRLSPYFTETDNNCNFQNGSLARHGNFWISFINDSTYSNEDNNASGFLIYPYCPLDYCHPPNSDIHINLNVFNGADAQCANNRSGLLCALCQSGLSPSLGSSRCISCSKAWYNGFVPISVISIVVGILLIALLMTLNLTVAIGTLNGLIFCTNIIGANSSMLFSGLSPSTKYYSVFISWLNLEVGFDVCFFEGMDIYWKTWLQLAFPAYVIFIVILTIIVSEHSMRFSRLIAKRNPVATLATLILLSYTKFLQTTIATLSLAILDYPNGSHKRVWLPDATVGYLSGKHIALFIVAVIILIFGTAYTCIIFFWQWLLHYQNMMILKWVRSQRLCHFIEPYHAPYILKHRYWTGLLLFTRIILYLVFAFNVSGDPGVNLLAIATTVVCLLLLKGQFDRVYKVTFIDITEMVSYTNLFVFSAVRLKFGTHEIVSITAHVSGVITLALLIIIISYHTYTTFCSKCSKQCQHQSERQLDGIALFTDNINTSSTKCNDHSEPTFSVVELELPGSGRQHSALASERGHCQVPQVINDANGDNISLDSNSPLFDSHDK